MKKAPYLLLCVWVIFFHLPENGIKGIKELADKTSKKHACIILTLLYSKTGVYRGIHYFSYFCPKT